MAVMKLNVNDIINPTDDKLTLDHLQATISSMLHRAERQRILGELKVAGQEESRSFISCGGRKAGNWAVSSTKGRGTNMDNMQFTIAFALRLGVEPFADIKPGHKCGLCGKAIGTSAIHGALCTREATGTGTRNERHYAYNTEVARILKWLDPTTRVKFEPEIVRHFHKQSKDWKKDARRRGDLWVRTSSESYIIDTSIGLAAAASAPTAANTKAGVVARKLAKDKTLQYVSAYKNFKEHEIVPISAEAEGTMDVFTLTFLKRRINDACDNNPALVRSTVAAEVYERMSCALQRANADGVINWRYAEYSSALYNSDALADPVHAALNSPAIDLAECDSDLRKEKGVAQAIGVAAAVGGFELEQDVEELAVAVAGAVRAAEEVGEIDVSQLFAAVVLAGGGVTARVAPEHGRL